jgi:hypothetical protein
VVQEGPLAKKSQVKWAVYTQPAGLKSLCEESQGICSLELLHVNWLTWPCRQASVTHTMAPSIQSFLCVCMHRAAPMHTCSSSSQKSKSEGGDRILREIWFLHLIQVPHRWAGCACIICRAILWTVSFNLYLCVSEYFLPEMGKETLCTFRISHVTESQTSTLPKPPPWLTKVSP